MQETAATDATAGQAGPRPPSASTPTKPVVLTTPHHARRRPVWGLALGGAVLAVVATLLAAWFWFREPPPQQFPDRLGRLQHRPPPGELPTDQIRYFHDWMPVTKPLDQTAVLTTWLPLFYKDRSSYPIPAPLVDDSRCGSCVLRGGSFFSEPRLLRSADRDGTGMGSCPRSGSASSGSGVFAVPAVLECGGNLNPGIDRSPRYLLTQGAAKRHQPAPATNGRTIERWKKSIPHYVSIYVKKSRNPDPTAAIIGSQSIKETTEILSGIRVRGRQAR